MRGGYVGVDVFFVISGFLITGLLVDELERTGTVSLVRFYSRRMKRLLPLTVVVLGTVVALSWLLFSPVRMEEVSFDIVTAGLYVINWRLAAQAVDYFAAGFENSPVQHFWSLAIEEQFYLLWPTLLLAATWWFRKKDRSLRPVLTIVFLAVAISSFIYGINLTDQEAGAAYFSTLTRAWELALGGMLALVPASYLRLPRWLSSTLVCIGLGAILWAIIRFSQYTPFPGTAALLPALGAAAIIAAGFTKSSPAAARLLTLRPVRHVGRISYSWYLWHWPLLVFATTLWGKLSPLEGLAVVAASYVPTIVTHRLVEKPFLYSEVFSRFPRKALGLGAACTAISVSLGLMLFAATPDVPAKPEGKATGAAALLNGGKLQKTADSLSPSPLEANNDRSQMDVDGCLLRAPETKSPECVYGDPSSKTTVVLFGDSHAMHWFPALQVLAKKHDWRLVGLTKSACPPAMVHRYYPPLRREYSECDTWREQTIQRILQKERPSMVVTSSITNYTVMEGKERLDRKTSVKKLEEGYAATLKELGSKGARVVVINDVPHPDKDIPECVSRSLQHLDECATPRSKAFNYPPVDAQAAKSVKGVSFIDPTPVLCLDKTCPAVIGDVIVYRNGSHLTATYVKTLAPWLDKQLGT